MTSAIERIEARRREVELQIKDLTGILCGLDMALEILRANPVPVPATVAADKDIVTIDTLSPLEIRIRELHAEGKINKEIAAQIEQEGMKCAEWKVSTVLRKLGLESHGKRLGGRRWEKKQANQDSEAAKSKVSEETEIPMLPRKRKTADERKEEVATLLEQGKSVEEIVAATGLAESSVKLYCSILRVRPKQAQGPDDALPEPEEDTESATGTSKRRESREEDEIDAKIRELHALKHTDQQMAKKIGRSKVTICQRRRRMGLPTNGKKGRPPGVRRSGKAAEEGDYPIIGGTKENPVYGSMRMKVVEEKIVDGHKVKVFPPGYAMGAEPPKNVCVRS